MSWMDQMHYLLTEAGEILESEDGRGVLLEPTIFSTVSATAGGFSDVSTTNASWTDV